MFRIFSFTEGQCTLESWTINRYKKYSNSIKKQQYLHICLIQRCLLSRFLLPILHPFFISRLDITGINHAGFSYWYNITVTEILFFSGAYCPWKTPAKYLPHTSENHSFACVKFRHVWWEQRSQWNFQSCKRRVKIIFRYNYSNFR